jgi:tRNA A37 N6-isopentenylltransferase MiaA
MSILAKSRLRKIHGYIVENNATALTTNFSTGAMEEVFGERFKKSRTVSSKTSRFETVRLFLGDTKRKTMSEKSIFTARQYSNRTCQYFKTRNQLSVE